MGRDSDASTDGPESVVAAVDSTDSHTRFVISDVTADGRWLSMTYSEAPLLSEWR